MKKFLFALSLLLIINSIATAIGQRDSYPEVPLSASVDEWQTLLQPSEGCEFPCWWGIRPGMRLSNVEAYLGQILPEYNIDYMYFDRVDESVLYTQNRGQIIYEEGEVGQPVYLSIRFSEEEIVQYILVSIAFAFEEHAEDIRPIVSYFRPSNVVEEYGIPDAILTDMKQFEERLDVGTLIFYWEETGLLIYYSTIFSLQEGLFETGGPRCFAPEYLSEIYIYLQDNENQQPIDEFVDDIFPSSSKLTKNLNEISAVGYDEFANILIENDDCLPTDFPVEGIDFWVGRQSN